MSNNNHSNENVLDGENYYTALISLIHLLKRVRKLDACSELEFLVLNETKSVLDYRQSAFWIEDKGVVAISGVTNFDKHAPFVQWLENWFSQAPKNNDLQLIQTDLRHLNAETLTDWQQWLPPHILSVNLPKSDTFCGGQLLFAADKAFSSQQLNLCGEWLDSWLVEYVRHTKLNRRQRLFSVIRNNNLRWFWRIAFVLTLIIISLIPVPLSVLAPADLVAKEPAIIRAPMDGVVKELVVEPNQYVEKDDVLFRFDKVAIENRLDLAETTLATVEANYRQQLQQALLDPRKKAELSVLRSQIEEKQIEVNYLQILYKRSEIVAPESGLVLFNDKTEWLGKPVLTGERVMMIADPKRYQVEAWLAPSDMIDFPAETNLKLYLSANPTQPLSATVTFISHQPELRPEGFYAYRVKADITQDHSSATIGLKGTARLEGETVSLIYWVFRRPWAALRSWLGV